MSRASLCAGIFRAPSTTADPKKIEGPRHDAMIAGRDLRAAIQVRARAPLNGKLSRRSLYKFPKRKKRNEDNYVYEA